MLLWFCLLTLVPGAYTVGAAGAPGSAVGQSRLVAVS